MRLHTFPAVVTFLVIAAAATAAPSPNLLLNPDAESGGTNGWTDVLGHGFHVYDGTSNFPVYEGAFSFWAGVTGPTGAYTNEIAQDVDVTAYAAGIDAGSVTAQFSGIGRSNSATGSTDYARIIVEYRTGNGSVLASHDSGNITPTNTYVPVSHQRTVPTGTRTIRVRLLGSRAGGISTDALFDDLRVTVEDVSTPARPSTWGALKRLWR